MSELNDPRVFFAAERTALAWNRTALTLMAFGFAIERFGLFMRMLAEDAALAAQADASYWVGILFILLGGGFALAAIGQYRHALASLKAIEIPKGYNRQLVVVINGAVGLLALLLAGYLLVVG